MKTVTLGKRQRNITMASVFTLAGVLYCLISLVNHYLFKTYSLDLGFYTHIMYDYAHFRIDDYFIFSRAPRCVLSDHFDLYLMLLSPLIYVFGSYTLLIVQIAGVLLGGWGVYKYITRDKVSAEEVEAVIEAEADVAPALEAETVAEEGGE